MAALVNNLSFGSYSYSVDVVDVDVVVRMFILFKQLVFFHLYLFKIGIKMVKN